MSQKIIWIDNLRAVACLMVVMIHSTTYYVTNGFSIGLFNWDVANILNSASRVCVPLFFMISGYLFFGEKSAQGRHVLHVLRCLLFYSALGLLYISTLTHINPWLSVRYFLVKPVFYHLWFFYAILALYIISPLISVSAVSAHYLVVVVAVLAVIANPNLPAYSYAGIKLLPVNLHISGDMFYYLLYALMGRALGMLHTERARISLGAALIFIGCVLAIAFSTYRQTQHNGGFADTYYMYCGPLVFIASCAILLFFKNNFNHSQAGWMAFISRHSLAIYGFHAFFIHFIRTHHFDIKSWPLLDIFLVFGLALAGSLACSWGLGKIDRKGWVS
ncbi:Inner membrane protein YiaH [Enterobacteriaceae bacterium bta3-1]|nr:Inner membrane protein YiaH [Enterobacteriaceae bacterium bta3-1]